MPTYFRLEFSTETTVSMFKFQSFQAFIFFMALLIRMFCERRKVYNVTMTLYQWLYHKRTPTFLCATVFLWGHGGCFVTKTFCSPMDNTSLLQINLSVSHGDHVTITQDTLNLTVHSHSLALPHPPDMGPHCGVRNVYWISFTGKLPNPYTLSSKYLMLADTEQWWSMENS